MIACQWRAIIVGRVSPRRRLLGGGHFTPHCVPCVGLLRESPAGAFWDVEQSRRKHKTHNMAYSTH